MIVVQIGACKAVFLLRPWMKLNVRVSRDNARHIESKERLGEICALRHVVHRLELGKGNVLPRTGHDGQRL